MDILGLQKALESLDSKLDADLAELIRAANELLDRIGGINIEVTVSIPPAKVEDEKQSG